jgi:phosphomevalonate kinase
MHPPTPAQGRFIGIAGKQFAGKDLLTGLLLDELPTFRKLPLALAIKQAYGKRHGLSLTDIEANKARHRPGLIAMGDWGRAQDPDYWLKKVLAEPGDKIISDVRLKREYDLLREHGAFLIRLEADRQVRSTRGQLVSEDDPTECQLDEVTGWDAVLTNNGDIDALRAQVHDFIPRIRAHWNRGS